MSKGRWKITASTARRLLQTLQAAGLAVDRIEAKPDGTLVFVPRDATTTNAQTTNNQNEWDAR
jgi:hypothetical protein